MGWCQGRVCGFATAALTAHLAGRPPDRTDLLANASRPLAAPVPLAQIARGAGPAAEEDDTPPPATDEDGAPDRQR
jgi:hypothetical protein